MTCRLQARKPFAHGERDPHHQVHWAGGIILGAVVIGPLGLSVSEKPVHEWQELIAGILGAGVTLFGAKLIVRQIKADDDREIRREKRNTLTLARTLGAELEAFLVALSERQHLIQKQGRLYVASLASDLVEIISSIGKHGLQSREVRERLAAGKADLSRLNGFREQAGQLGGSTAKMFSSFTTECARLSLEGVPDISVWGVESARIELQGIRGEMLLILINDLIAAEGDASVADQFIASTIADSAHKAWSKRIGEREKSWQLQFQFVPA